MYFRTLQQNLFLFFSVKPSPPENVTFFWEEDTVTVSCNKPKRNAWCLTLELQYKSKFDKEWQVSCTSHFYSTLEGVGSSISIVYKIPLFPNSLASYIFKYIYQQKTFRFLESCVSAMPEVIYKLKIDPTLRTEGNLKKRHTFRIEKFGKIESENR